MKKILGTVFLLSVLSACNSVTDGLESEVVSASISSVTPSSVYDCTSVSGYVNEPTCNVSTGAYCDGAWNTFPDGTLGFCFLPRDGWESCALNPGKWILNVNASAAYAGAGACNVRTSIFGCNSDVCKCDDSTTVLDAIADGPATSGVPSIGVGNQVTKDFNASGAVTEGKTIPTSVSATCEYAGDDQAALYSANHTVADCKDIERIVNQNGDLATHTGTERGRLGMVNIGGSLVSICVVPVARGTNPDPTFDVPTPPLTDPVGYATNWQLDSTTIIADPDLGCPAGWTTATTGGGLAYGTLKTHSFLYPAEADTLNGCAEHLFVRSQTGNADALSTSITAAFRETENKTEVAPTCAAGVWSENPTVDIVRNDLTHIACY